MKKFLLILILLFSASTSYAADIYFFSPLRSEAGDTFEVKIMADAKGEAINAVDLAISYDTDLLSFAGYKEGDAVVRLWVESPRLVGQNIHMSGIIPGGVDGFYDGKETGLRSGVPLANLLFKAESSGIARLSFGESYLYKNDGRGTRIDPKKESIEITIGSSKIVPGGEEGEGSVPDIYPPLPFDIIFIPAFGESPHVIMFEAKDADSGIKNYEIKIGGREWRDARSPVIVSTGIFPYTVMVRAYDHYGNFTDSSLEIPGYISPKIGLAFLLAIAALLFVLFYRRSKKNDEAAEV